MESQTSTPNQRAADSAAVVPAGFTYPALLLTLLRGPLPPIDPWMWLAERPGELERVATELAERHPDRRAVPFARQGVGDTVYCFDGLDLSGSPAVHVIHLSAPTGSEYRGQWATFEEWLFEADNVHSEWLRLS